MHDGSVILAPQFLLEGVRNRETVLYITLSVAAEELYDAAGLYYWPLDVHLLELDSPVRRIREGTLDSVSRLKISGEPLREFEGALMGAPRRGETRTPLLKER